MQERGFRHTKDKVGGFTLVELMVTIAVLVILLTLAVPNLTSFLQRQRVAADLDSLATSFQLARSEAMKRSGKVTICAKTAASPNDAPLCVNGSTNDWSNGWLVFLDYDSTAASGAYDSSVDTLLRVESPIRSASIKLSSSKSPITFQATGFATGAAVTFTVNPQANMPDAANRRCLVMSLLGKFRISDPNDNTQDCQVLTN